MKIQKGSTTLVIMLIVAAAAILFGLVVMYKRTAVTPSLSNQASSDANQTPATDPSQDQADQTPITSPVVGFTAPANWLTYTNSKYGFSLKYPPNLKVGAVSANSVLGTYSVPVKGFHVGPLVLVVLRDVNIKKDAMDYFNGFYNPSPSQAPTDQVAGACTIDKIINTSVVSIKSVSCIGEGGAGSYAYIQGPTFDVFVDGYSKGFDAASFGDLTKNTDYGNILSTFKFGSDGTVR